MADFVKELGTALQVAFRADTDLRTILGTYDGSTYHADVADQRQSPEGGAGMLEASLLNQETLERTDTSARKVYRFQATFHAVDVRGVDSAKTVCAKGFENVFKDHGAAILDTHLVDSASNRLGKSGGVDLEEWQIIETEDQDRFNVDAVVAFDITHVSPLV